MTSQALDDVPLCMLLWPRLWSAWQRKEKGKEKKRKEKKRKENVFWRQCDEKPGKLFRMKSSAASST